MLEVDSGEKCESTTNLPIPHHSKKETRGKTKNKQCCQDGIDFREISRHINKLYPNSPVKWRILKKWN